MAIVIALILGLLALAFVLYPLLRRSEAKSGADQVAPAQVELREQERAATTEGQETAAKAALQEVELDYQLGNIDEPDYRSMRERYMRRALVALKARYDQEQALDEMIEEQLRSMREQNEEDKDDAKQR
ncbi:hypothetical protein [Ktedonobacter racemifer]|uniref:C-type cytochrome biogenesis protein CcmI n=1 Tax=Ktedonobacter racemifer DSM 44963 TaxID=485913 RepID=D6TNF1_KTERA|nr:hypothetical protein [Ktedonobacter racemifer]EFH87282.1 hypothetical protein Krac_8612 [Ktedonobacter racemifer DSM 44963]